MKKALITGLTGQDGSYLAELLLEKGYEVHALVRRVALENPEHHMTRIDKKVRQQLILHPGALESFASLVSIVAKVVPDECYHLAAQSYVTYSFEDAFSTLHTNINGTHYMLEAIASQAPTCRFYFAASSEMFGNTNQSPQNEQTPFFPRSPYGISKLSGYHLTRNYREAYDLFAVSGILFNHESPRRGLNFVTRKISHAVARIRLGLLDKLRLGNLEAKRDWGFAGDYVRMMWQMLQQEKPDDYVVATGETHSVQELVERAFDCVGLDWSKYVEVDETLYRPAEIFELKGDYSLAKRDLGWEPEIRFDALVEMMVRSDLEALGGRRG